MNSVHPLVLVLHSLWCCCLCIFYKRKLIFKKLNAAFAILVSTTISAGSGKPYDIDRLKSVPETQMIGSDWLTVWELQNSLWGRRPKTDPWHGQCPCGRAEVEPPLTPPLGGRLEGSLTIGLHGHAHPRSFSTTLCSVPKRGILSKILTVSSRAEHRCLNPH